MRPRHVTIVAVSVVAATAAGWNTVWGDRLSRFPAPPPIQIAADDPSSAEGRDAERSKGSGQGDGAERSHGESVSGSEPMALPGAAAEGDDEVEADRGD